jgi:CheY-like chemotaxis protein
MNRPQWEDAEAIVLWNHKPLPHKSKARLIVVLHRDDATGATIAGRLRSEEFVHHTDIRDVELILGHWRPSVLLIDMRLATQDDLRFVRSASHDPGLAHTLLIAITDPAVKGGTRAAREAGFDGLCYGPCQIWRLAEMLYAYLARSSDPACLGAHAESSIFVAKAGARSRY